MHFPLRLHATVLLAVLTVSAFAAGNVRMVGIVFDRGADTAETADEITGDESVMYRFKPKDGQFLHVSLRASNQHTEFVLRAPGKWPGEEMYNSETGGNREYEGAVYRDGFHSVTVLQSGDASRENKTSEYDLVIRLTDSAN